MTRIRTPRHILDLKGTARKDRHSNTEPKPLAGLPKCPARLTKEAKTKWRALVKAMGPCVGVFTQADAEIMATYCSALAMRDEAEKLMNQVTMTSCAGETGRAYYKQLMVNWRAATQVIDNLGGQFGWSPVARAKMDVSGFVPPIDDKERFFADRESV